MRGAQRRYVLWAVGRLGVSGCLACVAAAAVDRQAQQFCRVCCGGMNRVGPTARRVRSASECVRGRTGSACAARHTPTLNALVGKSGRLSSHHQSRHDKTVLSVSCLVCRCESDDCSARVQTSAFLLVTVLSCRDGIHTTEAGATRTRQFCRVCSWRGGVN